MQNYTTIMGVIRMREAHSSYDECQRRYQIGSSTCQLIMKRFKSIGLSFQDLQKMDEQKVVDAFYPPDQARRKKTPLPDYEKIYEALTAKGSKANLFYLWTAYKKEYPDGYQYTQFVEYFKRFAEKHYGLRKVSMAVERVPGQRVYIDKSECCDLSIYQNTR